MELNPTLQKGAHFPLVPGCFKVYVLSEAEKACVFLDNARLK